MKRKQDVKKDICTWTTPTLATFSNKLTTKRNQSLHFELQQTQEGKENMIHSHTKVHYEEFSKKKKKDRNQNEICLPRSLNISKYLKVRMESIYPPLAALLYCSNRIKDASPSQKR